MNVPDKHRVVVFQVTQGIVLDYLRGVCDGEVLVGDPLKWEKFPVLVGRFVRSGLRFNFSDHVFEKYGEELMSEAMKVCGQLSVGICNAAIKMMQQS